MIEKVNKKEERKRKRIWFASLRPFLPLLHINLQIPFFGIDTSLMHERKEYYIFDYLSLHIRFFKWHGTIALYTTKVRVIESKYDY